MKRRFTILTAAFMLLAFLAIPMGMMGQTTKTYILTINADDFNTTSYAANNNEKTSNAVNTEDSNDTYEVTWTSYQVMKNGTNMQWQKSKGYIFNTTELGTITDVTVTSSAGTFTTYYGTAAQPSSSTTVGGGYFQTKVGGATGTTSQLKVTFEITEGGSQTEATTVTIDDSGITNTDVYAGTTAGSLSATVTDNNNNTISGAIVTWSSSNENVATIDANGEITLVAEGTTTITASYAGESGVYYGSSATYDLEVSDTTPFTGGDVTFVAGTDMGSTTATGPDSMTKKVVTISSDNAAFGYNDNYRLYKNSVTTVSTTYGVITNITFTQSGSYAISYLTPNTGTLENNIWTGSATSIEFTNDGTNQTRATQIVVTIAAPAVVATPTFSLESGTYYETKSVTISCETENSVIYYTIDGTEPTSASTLYTQAITIAETTTIKAIAYVGTDHSYVATATYTIEYPINTIPALFNAATGTEANVLVTFNNWVVSGVSTNGKSVFVTDNNGNGFVIFDNNGGLGNTYTVGDILAGTAVSCNLKKYNGYAELLNVDANDLTITTGGTVTIANVAMADLAGINTGALLHYNNLTCSVNNNKYYLSDGTTTIQVYNALYVFDALEDGKIYNITGIYQQYNSTKEILPRSAEDIQEVYTLDITGYEAGSNGGYYLIASPVTVDPEEVEGMTTDDFDLYYFDEAEDNEWRNYEAHPFNLVPGKGYLYAKQATTEGEIFHFELTGTPYDSDGTIELNYTEGGDFPGWNLVGNPFGMSAYIDRDFYIMNPETGAELIQSSGEIAAMQGIFVIANEDGEELTFSTEAPANNNEKLVLNVTRNRGTVIDRAIVRFGQGGILPKFQLNENNTKICFVEGETEYAVVRSANEGEMPVSFKASENGRYTISVNAENIEMEYLHLIDNMTGADVDLLATPSYSFEANTTDYTSRFRLVFSANNGISEQSNETFAFFNGSNWVVNNNGEATLQVIDMTGRVLSSEQINGSYNKSLNLNAGVYVLRLSNGNVVKTQKVVID